MFNLFVYLHFGDIFACFVIIYIKGKYDLLEGFNKLDNLIKVSIFQKYKDPKLEERRMTACLNDLMVDRIQNKNTGTYFPALTTQITDDFMGTEETLGTNSDENNI